MNAMSEIGAIGHAVMDASPDLGALFKALSEVQAGDLTASFNRENPAFKQGNRISRYADLTAVWDAVRGPLAAHKLTVIQMPACHGSDVSVRTLLGHESGQWIASTVSAKAADPSPQKIGGAITYLRRYGLCAMLGVVADVDDDGNAAQGRSETAPAKPPVRHPVEWAYVSARDGKREVVEDREAWQREWGVRLNSVEKSNKTPEDKLRMLEAMRDANLDVLGAIWDAGHEDVSGGIDKAIKAAIARISKTIPAQEPPTDGR